MAGVTFKLVLAVLFITGYVAAFDPPTCKPIGEGGDVELFAKPDNCSQYYECSNGVLMVMECPPGLQFNAINETCDYDYSVNCKPEIPILLTIRSLEDDLPTCPPPGDGDVVLFPKPDNCSQYYECDNGKLVVMDCPPDLEFNAINDTCDYSYSANCKVQTPLLLTVRSLADDLPTCPPPGDGDVVLFPKPDNCSQYYECDNGKLVVMDCPPDLEFNAVNDTCDYSYSANCKVEKPILLTVRSLADDVPTCPPPGAGDIVIYEKPDNCSQYYECDNGRLLVMDCPPNLEFNAANKTCDYPYSAKCKVETPIELTVRSLADDLPTCPPPGAGDIVMYAKPDNCSQYYECDNGKLLVMECPPELEFNAANKTCDHAYSAHCEVQSPIVLSARSFSNSLPNCPAPGEGAEIEIFAQPGNCSQYVLCDNGKIIVMDCPPGLVFNNENKTCDYPYAAHCTAESSDSSLIISHPSLSSDIIILPEEIDKLHELRRRSTN